MASQISGTQWRCTDCRNYFYEEELYPFAEEKFYHDGTSIEVLLCEKCYNYRMNLCYPQY